MRRYGMVLMCGTLAVFGFVLAGQAQLGGGKGFGGGRFGANFAKDPLALLRLEQVKKELDLSEEQVEKLPAAVLKAIGEVLNDKQMKRFRQIELQVRGPAAFTDQKVRTELKITDQQARDIDTVLEDSRKETAEVFKEAKGGNFKGVGEKMEGIQKETREKVMGVLTADQRKAYKQMIGEEFKLELPKFGFGKKGKNKDE